MDGSISYRDPLLINTVGHSVGVLLFGVLVVLLFKDQRHNGLRQTRLSLIAGLLAFLWNLGSLLVLASSGRETLLLEAVVTFSFSVLSLLPAVLLHLVLKHTRRAFVICGYLMSGLAVLLHLVELAEPPSRPHQAALLVISAGFGLLVVITMALSLRSVRKPFALDSEVVSLGCLLLFTLSFVHFGYGHATSAWTSEIAWHHASIPLALFVLLQDYRFLLLDVFFRFLLNFGLAAAYALAAFALNERFQIWARMTRDEFWMGVGLVGLCVALISFAFARAVLQRWLTLRLFRRSGIEVSTTRLASAAAKAQTEQQVLQECAAALAECLSADRFLVQLNPMNIADGPLVTGSLPKGRLLENPAWVEAVIPLRFSRGDTCQILLGARLGGRRYLSEDLDLIRRLSGTVIEQVERFRGEALQRLVAQAELRALQSQINPHFLFNALNTLYGTIDRTSYLARRFVLNLAEIFRYFLRTDQTYIRLEEELQIVRAYLEIEKLRLGDRLETSLSVPEPALSTLIPVLTIQPLVENAVKHGIAAKRDKGCIAVIVSEIPGGLSVKVQDTGVGFAAEPRGASSGNGIGLKNVRQRLRLCYGDQSDLDIRSGSGGTVVSFVIPAGKPDTPAGIRSSDDLVHPPAPTGRSF
jgi:two-component system, LytTR family, sensor kinase